MSPAAQDWHGVQMRGDEAARLMGIAFREFKQYTLFKPGDAIGQAVVWQGESNSVPLTVNKPLNVTMQVDSRAGMKVSLVYDGPVKAPVTKGEQIGVLKITAPDYPTTQLPVYAAADVPRVGIFGRMFLGLRTLILGPPA
jgi:D-alanyl-D-alanine carboxypeptidase (penicillin-binding protein 5/6)